MRGEWSALSLYEAYITLIDCDHRIPSACVEKKLTQEGEGGYSTA